MALFQNSGARTQTKPGVSRLSLAAFGKHPGWDDHISGIGVETEVLAHIKQSLYVGGIGRQIDLGAWEKLDAAKRVEGFDHTFFWFRDGHVVLGRFWSSKDRKGRAKYPMVLCVDSEGLAPEFLMARAGAELENLRASCKAVTSATQVTAECGSAQDRLRALLETEPPAESAATSEQKQRFLACPALGPDRVGLLRVLHELDNALGVSSGNRPTSAAALANLHPYHIRVPLCLGSPNEALLVWAEFLRGILPHAVPLMLIARNEVSWLDVIVGEPSSDDFFCLQASPQALPLATEIPYELGPDLRARFNEMESQFLAAGSSANSGGTIFIKKPAAQVDAGGGAAASPKKNRKGWLWLLVGLVVIGAAGAGIFFALPVANKAFVAHLQAAQSALDSTNFTLARQELDAALKIKPDDPAAARLKTELERRQHEIAVQAENERAYKDAMAAAQAAFDQKDYQKAVSQADGALKIKANDSAAAKLKSDAQAQQLVVTAQAENDLKYKQAMAAAHAAFDKQDLGNALAQADAALAVRPDDAEATKLKSEVQARQRELAAQAERNRQYQQAMAQAQAAFDRQDYVSAAAQATAALGIRPNDPAAAKLKADVQARQREASARAEMDRKYREAMAAAQAAFDHQDYVTAATQAGAALVIKANDSAAGQLLSQARQKKTEQDQAALAAQQPAQSAIATNQPPPIVAAVTAANTQVTNAPIQIASVDQYDMALRNLMIQLHVKATGPNILTNGGTTTPLPRGFLPADSVDQFNKEVDRLRKIYQDNKWLDAERKKDLDKLSDALLSWN